MRTIKTQDLIGDPLDWAVGAAYWHPKAVGTQAPFSPSTDWSQGGPIIYREKIGTWTADGLTWHGKSFVLGLVLDGPTPLIAGLRCYVASKLGDTVEVPEELL